MQKMPTPETTIQCAWRIVRPLIQLGIVSTLIYGTWQAMEPERLSIIAQWQLGDPRIRIILLMMVPVVVAALLYAITDRRSLASKISRECRKS